VLRSVPFIVPAQPRLRVRPPVGDAWLHEVKFDGYRCQIHKAGKDVVIFSRNGREFTDRFLEIRDAVLTLPCRSAIIDGEVVVCNEDGIPNFRRLHFRRYADQTLCVWTFDVMKLNGADLRPLPLIARKQKLAPCCAGTTVRVCGILNPSRTASSSLLYADRAASRASCRSASTRLTNRANVIG